MKRSYGGLVSSPSLPRKGWSNIDPTRAVIRSSLANAESEGLAKSIAEKTGVDPNVLRVSSRDPVVSRVLKDEALRDFLAALDDALAGESQNLESVDGIGEELAEKLKEAGIHTLDDLKNASEEDLIAVDGVGKSKAAKLKAP